MDDALVLETNKDFSNSKLVVLILVVMDDALVLLLRKGNA